MDWYFSVSSHTPFCYLHDSQTWIRQRRDSGVFLRSWCFLAHLKHLASFPYWELVQKLLLVLWNPYKTALNASISQRTNVGVTTWSFWVCLIVLWLQLIQFFANFLIFRVVSDFWTPLSSPNKFILSFHHILWHYNKQFAVFIPSRVIVTDDNSINCVTEDLKSEWRTFRGSITVSHFHCLGKCKCIHLFEEFKSMLFIPKWARNPLDMEDFFNRP